MDYTATGWACNAYTNSQNISCAPGEVAVGIYGGTGWIIDRYALICQSVSGGSLTGSSYNEVPLIGAGVGGGFTMPCPAGQAIYEILWNNNNPANGLCGAANPCLGQVGISALITRVEQILILRGPSGTNTDGGGIGLPNTPFDYACASGTFLTGLSGGPNNSSNYSGNAFIDCLLPLMYGSGIDKSDRS